MQTFILLLLTSLFAPFCNAAPYTQKDLNEEMVTATNWQQLAPEYEALLYQAFNIASDKLPEAIANTPPGKKPALVADIDQTLLDSSRYFSSLIGTNDVRSVERSRRWWKVIKSRAIPGAAEFIQKAKSLGVEIFYITGRFNDVKEMTIAGLTDSGFPVTSEEHLLLQQPLSTTLGKEDRRQSIRDKGYHLAMLLGDHLEDLGPIPKDHYTIKKQWVKEHNNHYSNDWLTLPNLMYGTWQDSVVTKNYSKLPPEAAHSANIAALSGSWFNQIQNSKLAQQSIGASVWQHTSSEYDALAYQAFNQAKDLINATKNTQKTTTVVIDVNGSLLRFLPEQPFSQSAEKDNLETYFNWISSELKNVQATPGALAFINAAKNAGSDIFYISELPVSEEDLINKLKALGLPEINKSTVIARNEFYSESSDESTNKSNDQCDKSKAKAMITNASNSSIAREITLQISDSLEDFDLPASPDNPQTVTTAKALFGRQYIVIPNPLIRKE